MSVTHLKSNIVADFTGTVTVHNSQGSTTTVAASDLVRPSDWNSAHAQLWTLTGNTTQNSTASGTNIILAASGGGVSVGGSNGSLVVSGPVLAGYHPHGLGAESVAGQQGAGTLYVQPVNLPAAVAFDRLVFPLVLSNTSNSSNSYTLSMSYGLYTRSGSTLSSVSSGSTSYAASASGTAGSYSLWGGPRNLTLGATGTLQPGNYFLGIWSRTSANAAGQTLNQALVSQPNSAYSGIVGAASNATDQPMLGMGRYSVSFSTAMPSSVALSHIQGNSSILQRAPLFFFASGTA